LDKNSQNRTLCHMHNNWLYYTNFNITLLYNKCLNSSVVRVSDFWLSTDPKPLLLKCLSYESLKIEDSISNSFHLTPEICPFFDTSDRIAYLLKKGIAYPFFFNMHDILSSIGQLEKQIRLKEDSTLCIEMLRLTLVVFLCSA
jgi:hypothetical protein